MSTAVSQARMRSMEKIDDAFEYVLLLIGVFAAGIFEFSVYLESAGFIEKEVPVFFFRALFSSLALLVLIWFLSVIIERTTYRIWLRLVGWGLGSLILRTILVAFINWGFLFFPPSATPSAFSMTMFSLMSLASSLGCIGVLYCILRVYMTALRSVTFFRSWRWALFLSLGWGFSAAINYGIFAVSIVEFVGERYPVFSGLLPYTIGLFFITLSLIRGLVTPGEKA